MLIHSFYGSAVMLKVPRSAVRKKDREFQQAGERYWCEAGHTAEQTCWHHIRKRRNLEIRWDEKFCIRLCKMCHADIEHYGERRFLERYLLSELTMSESINISEAFIQKVERICCKIGL